MGANLYEQHVHLRVES